MTLLVHPVDDRSTAPDTWIADPPSSIDDHWRDVTPDDLLGVAGFLAGNVLAHRADPDECARELLSWADGRTEPLAAAARAIAHDMDQRPAHRLLCTAIALAAPGGAAA